MRKKMVYISHSCGLIGDFFSFVKCELTFLLYYCVFHETYTPKNSLNQVTGAGIFRFRTFLWQICFMFYVQLSEVIIY